MDQGHLPIQHFRRFPRLKLELQTGRLTEADSQEGTPDSAVGTAPPVEPGPAGLQALRVWTSAARSQRRDVQDLLDAATAKHASLLDRQRRRASSPLRRFLSSDRSGDLGLLVSDAEAEIAVLEEWLRASSIELRFEPEDLVLQSYAEVTSAFVGLQRSAAAWYLAAASDVGAPAGPLSSTERRAVRLELGDGNVVRFGAKTLKVRATAGPAITFYPGMLMTVTADGSRDLLGLRDIHVDARLVHLAETDVVPADAKIVKNAPDPSSTRFGDPSLHHDHRLPICVYAQMTVRGPSGVIAEYQFSNAEAGRHFADTFSRYQAHVLGR